MIITYIIKLHKTKILHFFYKFDYFFNCGSDTFIFLYVYIHDIYLYETMDNYHGNKNIQTQKYHILEIMMVSFNLTFRDSLFMDDVNYTFLGNGFFGL